MTGGNILKQTKRLQTKNRNYAKMKKVRKIEQKWKQKMTIN